MKVRYIKDYPDPSVSPDYVFKNGWTAEHDPATGNTRIAEGFCVEVHPGTQSRKLSPVKDTHVECIPEPEQKPKKP